MANEIKKKLTSKRLLPLQLIISTLKAPEVSCKREEEKCKNKNQLVSFLIYNFFLYLRKKETTSSSVF